MVVSMLCTSCFMLCLASMPRKLSAGDFRFKLVPWSAADDCGAFELFAFLHLVQWTKKSQQYQRFSCV